MTPKDTVRITIHIQDNELNIKVYDHGQGFDLETVPLPDFDQPKRKRNGHIFHSNIDGFSHLYQTK